MQDVASTLGPDKRFGIGVVVSDVFIDYGNEFGDAGEYATAKPLGGDIAEEALDHVQPGCRGRREMHNKARVFVEPRLHGRMLVRGVVVGNQVQRLVLRRLAASIPSAAPLAANNV